MIRDALYGTALQQGFKPKPISARRESAPNESMPRIQYYLKVVRRISTQYDKEYKVFSAKIYAVSIVVALRRMSTHSRYLVCC